MPLNHAYLSCPCLCRVRNGTASQSVVVCTGKYPGGKSQQWFYRVCQSCWSCRQLAVRGSVLLAKLYF